MKQLRYENCDVDATDLRILTVLADNGRVSIADLARAIGMSAPSVADRIRRLEQAGVIEGYTIAVNPQALGLPLSVWLRVRPVPGQLQTVAGILTRLSEIVECDRVTGEDCFIARAHVTSVEHLERVIDQIIPFAMTNTAIIQSSPVKRRMPTWPAESH